MFRFVVAFLFFAIISCLLERVSRAQERLLPVPILPSIVAPLPISVLTAATRSERSAAAAAGALTPLDYRFLARVARLLDGLHLSTPWDSRDAAWRTLTLHDPTRERDATWLGIRSAPMSSTGALIAGFGIGATAAQLIDLAKLATRVPVTFAPTMCQGGGGVSVNAGW